MIGMMKKRTIPPYLFLLGLGFLLTSCQGNSSNGEAIVQGEDAALTSIARPVLSVDLAENIKRLPMHCITVEYPNAVGHRLYSADDLKSPKELHPTFYGCFDWHSSVHGHWSLVKILKTFPEISESDEIKQKLNVNISAANVRVETAYLLDEKRKSFERPYGWAWVLKLAEELQTWDDPFAKELNRNLQPLTDLIIDRFITYIPTMKKPVRSGSHSNTAFSLTFVWDYAEVSGNQELMDVIERKAREFYLPDSNYNLAKEPEGGDFLSPALEQINLLARVLDEQEFETWLEGYLPELKDPSFRLQPGIVLDRTDGQFGHIDGLNFSRAWCLEYLADNFSGYDHLRQIAYHHIKESIEVVSDGEGGAYEASGHWLGSFALYALLKPNF